MNKKVLVGTPKRPFYIIPIEYTAQNYLRDDITGKQYICQLSEDGWFILIYRVYTDKNPKFIVKIPKMFIDSMINNWKSNE